MSDLMTMQGHLCNLKLPVPARAAETEKQVQEEGDTGRVLLDE